MWKIRLVDRPQSTRLKLKVLFNFQMYSMTCIVVTTEAINLCAELDRNVW